MSCRALSSLFAAARCRVRNAPSFPPAGFWTVQRRAFASTASTPPRITHVIFDFDGVIVDSETVFFNINAECMRRYGGEYSNELKQGQMGRRLAEGVDWLLKAAGLHKRVGVDEYVKLCQRMISESMGGVQLLKGAEQLLSHLSAHRVPTAICTGSDRQEFALKTTNYGHIVEKIGTIVLTGDDPEVKRGKPAPDPYLITMSRMRPEPESARNVLVIEDAVNGAKSGIAAGATTILVPQNQFLTDGWGEVCAELKQLGLHGIHDSLEDIDLGEFGLPPLKRRTATTKDKLAGIR